MRPIKRPSGHKLSAAGLEPLRESVEFSDSGSGQFVVAYHVRYLPVSLPHVVEWPTRAAATSTRSLLIASLVVPCLLASPKWLSGRRHTQNQSSHVAHKMCHTRTHRHLFVPSGQIRSFHSLAILVGRQRDRRRRIPPRVCGGVWLGRVLMPARTWPPLGYKVS